ncbi:tetratricopeptide repeat protein [Nonomuraea sp. NEAU-A123]|uniref:tetratricopeptide repeat protein n=1 Tax=Nonomuraea sp. NEAU-A123 TaxID=2839649 RepID=UPI001BE3F309|nr:tetratricopeptide repeat protein [Nonomuraea sp. NEAU-A123]MBT2233518.1 tetratricopeptide repeat protein [Nonomuraea sp. NEAU-A123]
MSADVAIIVQGPDSGRNAQSARRLADQVSDGGGLMAVQGRTSPDELLASMASAPDRSADVAAFLRNMRHPWQPRLAVAAAAGCPVLLLTGFERNLKPAAGRRHVIADRELEQFLDRWHGPVVIASRHAFRLAGARLPQRRVRAAAKGGLRVVPPPEAHLAVAERWTRAAQAADTPWHTVAALLEARYQFARAGDSARAYQVTMSAVRVLNRHGALSWREHILREAYDDVECDSREAADLLWELGLSAQQRQDHESARAHYLQAQALFDEWQDEAGRAGSLHQLGMLAEAEGRLDHARALTLEAMASFESLGERGRVAAGRRELSRIASASGESAQAADLERQALTDFERLGDTLNVARCRQQLAQLAHAAGDSGEATAQLRTALKDFERLGDTLNLARCRQQLGQLTDSTTHLDLAAREFQQVGDATAAAVCRYEIGMSEWLQGNHTQAIASTRAALAAFDRIGDLAGMANCHQQLGGLLTTSARPREAVPHTLQALLLHRRLGLPVDVDEEWLRQQRSQLGAESFTAIT